ncbi:MAG: tRNA (N6-isopentenyl adenosine(37)-C2)-methylthiotransferase MiaB [Thermovirgaceae bacterium]|nr:tRNA (N6-isopentenyl adenosine(37)-C2)-methylthiotransferase MiaB [Thermovirgaceae bacterium]
MYCFSMKIYGCQMNVYDADRLRTALVSRGWLETPEEEADIVIFVTCSIRDKAEQKVWSEIGRLNSAEGRTPPAIAVAGCMAQRTGTQLMKRYSSVCLVCGPRSLGKLPGELENVMRTGQRVSLLDENPVSLDDLAVAPLLRANPWKAFITIANGCDNFCTYCIVPYVRGRFISREPVVIFREVEELVSSGVREITLIGQNVNTYGRDFDNGYVFSSLLDDVASMDGVERVRFSTSHPKDLTKDVVDVMSRRPSVCPGINLPIQSGSDQILKLMNRGYTVEKFASIVEMIRSALPDGSLTSDLIVGFPGETSADFERSVEAVERFRFDMIHTAAYSPREGTSAAGIEGQISGPEKRRRLGVVNSIQTVISQEINEALVGRTFSVLADGTAPRGDSMLQGRTPSDKVVIFPGDISMLGSFFRVRITGTKKWCLSGEVVKADGKASLGVKCDGLDQV